MDLYHASQRLHVPGEVIAGRKRELSPEFARAEARLARYLPPGVVPRTIAVYAADSAAFAAKYLHAEHADPLKSVCGGESKYLYRVAAERPSGHPMILVSMAGHARDEEHFAAIAREYWMPTQKWLCREYLCPEFRVVAEEAWPDGGYLAGAAHMYGLDLARARRLFLV